MTKLRKCLYVREKQCGSDGWVYRLDEIGKRVAAFLYAREHKKPLPQLPPFADFDKVALGWKEGDVDNHTQYFNYREGGDEKLQCPYCTKQYKTQRGLSNHIGTKHADAVQHEFSTFPQHIL